MDMKQPFSSRAKLIEALIHIIGWGIVLAFPYLMMTRSGFEISLENYLRHGSIVPLSFFIVFYVNYFILIPRYLFNGHTKQYLAINLLIILAMTAGSQLLHELFRHVGDQPLPDIPKEPLHKSPLPPPEGMPKPMKAPKWVFLSRDVFSMVLTVGLSVAIRLSGRWVQIENARREAERARTEAELTNLRNQLNPHFLLNTLNNIYALIAFDTEKAQTAVQELSRLLRHMLYENKQSTVPLVKELDFIRNYIELMRIRLAANVTLDTRFDIRPDSPTQIAPLIYISLIENAFKHGISPTKASHITIRFSEDSHSVSCDIRNSYHPKSETDKSGSGIGLEQVRKRLELTYPNRYEWKQGVCEDCTEYYSQLTIYI